MATGEVERIEAGVFSPLPHDDKRYRPSAREWLILFHFLIDRSRIHAPETVFLERSRCFLLKLPGLKPESLLVSVINFSSSSRYTKREVEGCCRLQIMIVSWEGWLYTFLKASPSPFLIILSPKFQTLIYSNYLRQQRYLNDDSTCSWAWVRRSEGLGIVSRQSKRYFPGKRMPGIRRDYILILQHVCSIFGSLFQKN